MSLIAKAPPATMSAEHKAATKEYLLQQNANPIRGISSKKNQEEDDD